MGRMGRNCPPQSGLGLLTSGLSAVSQVFVESSLLMTHWTVSQGRSNFQREENSLVVCHDDMRSLCLLENLGTGLAL